MKKQTASNNEFLAQVKKIVNSKIYKETLEIYNKQGQKKAEEYLNTFFNWDNLKVKFD